ncbi:hypothetical protein [Streptomyces aquilus]|uniref:hypothetical protein n=1 Tax=Streptomyces aquilus TaxID=2548456 RepID=UPI003692431C
MRTLDIELLGALRERAAVPLPSNISGPSGGPHLSGGAGRHRRVLEGWSKVSTGRRHEICVYRWEVQEAEPPVPAAPRTGD